MVQQRDELSLTDKSCSDGPKNVDQANDDSLQAEYLSPRMQVHREISFENSSDFFMVKQRV
jgi:hypothetical protein